jgi:hypothetical protein
VVAAVLARGVGTEIVRPDGGRARVVGKAPQGGLRVDGGEGGFAVRTVSLIDLAWVCVAAEGGAPGVVLDEGRVNSVRYLEGTPKGSTRWIDTGWAIGIWRAVRGSGRDER